MRNTIAIIFVTITLYSCNSSNNRVATSTRGTEILAKSTDFIDVDLKYFTDTTYTLGHQEIPIEVMKRIKAVIYRVFSTIELKDNQYILNIKKGSDIHISEELFNIYKENINTLNQEATKLNQVKNSPNKSIPLLQDTGKLTPITDEYLNSLLED